MTRHTGYQQEWALSKLDPKEKGREELVLRESGKDEWLPWNSAHWQNPKREEAEQ